MIDQQTIFIIVGVSSSITFLLGGLIIGFVILNRPNLLKRRRVKQVGVLGSSGDGGASEKAENRRQRRIKEKIKQLEGGGNKKGYIDNIREMLMQTGKDIGIATYFIASAALGVAAAAGCLIASFPLWQAGLAFLVGSILVPKFIIKKWPRSYRRNSPHILPTP